MPDNAPFPHVTADAAPAMAPPARRPAHWPIVLLRALAVLVLLQVFLQAVLAGGFITGKVTFLGLHSANGVFLVLSSMALPVAAVLLVRPGRGPWWPIVFGVVLWLLIGVQVGIGFARLVGLHIPIGMAIMALSAGLTWWAFAYRTKR
ncbi:hypothetical protein AB0M20_36140 [Actinoplanes sp. NPDC051633]|uniref:hypothetical protein n=1 Tax=Actinoplanes sp. NPDC051633 TaxID=3155670 RepID=UPI00342C1F6A